MIEMNNLAILVAAVAAVVTASLWYGVFSARLAAAGSASVDSARSPAVVLPVELARGLVLAAVVAAVAAGIDIATWTGAVALGLALWVGFPVVLLTGSVFHENVPWRVAAIHAGDWLVKLVVVALIVGLWR